MTKGLTPKYVGGVQGGARQGCGDLGQKLQDCDHRRPRGLAGEGRCGNLEKGRISQSCCLT